MKCKENLKLRKVGRQYMIVDVTDGRADVSVVYTMNDTAAGLWKKIGDGECNVKELVDWMCREYEVDPNTALTDIERQVEDWKKYGLLV